MEKGYGAAKVNLAASFGQATTYLDPATILALKKIHGSASASPCNESELSFVQDHLCSLRGWFWRRGQC